MLRLGSTAAKRWIVPSLSVPACEASVMAGPDVQVALQRVGEKLAQSRRVVLVCHEFPDPDTAGSALALADTLRAVGKKATVLIPTPIPGQLSSLVGWPTVTHDMAAARRAVRTADCVVSIDNTDLDRFANFSWVFPAAQRNAITTVNIDHHGDNHHFADLNCVDPEAPATGVMIYRLAQMMGWPIGRGAANDLYAAIVSDTGDFKHPANYPDVFDVSSALARLGADPPVVSEWLSRLTLPQFRLVTQASEMLAINSHGLVHVCITNEMLGEAGASTGDVHFIADHLQRLDICQVLALIVQGEQDDLVRVSFRAVRGIDASQIARELGGGGRAPMAAAKLKCSLPDARRQVLAAASKVIGRRGGSGHTLVA